MAVQTLNCIEPVDTEKNIGFNDSYVLCSVLYSLNEILKNIVGERTTGV